MDTPLPCLPEAALFAAAEGTPLANLSPSELAHYTKCGRCQSQIQTLTAVWRLLRDQWNELEGPTNRHTQPLPGRYEFLRRLGRGGFGEVWLAYDVNVGRRVAVKTLRHDRVKPGALQALRAEARQLAALAESRKTRRHLVQVYGLEQAADQCFLIMEYVEGGSLGDRIRQFGPLHWPAAVRYVSDVGELLSDVHSKGILHRDIKPDNILWSQLDDEALLADFGLASHINAATGVGGTPGYMAPEVFQGAACAKSDVFGLSATLYYLITGKAPFAGSDMYENLRLAEAGLPKPDPLLRHVPAAISATLRAALTPAKQDRLKLDEYTRRLRGAGSQALGLSLEAPATMAETKVDGLDLSVTIWVEGPGGRFDPAPTIPVAKHEFRDLGFVASDARCVRAITGSNLRLRFHTRSGGYLTLLNVGSSGNLSITYPNAQSLLNRLGPGERRDITVRLTPPAGEDEAIGILTHQAETLIPEEWHRRILSGKPSIDAYAAFRDLEFLASRANEASAQEWVAAVAKIAHS